MEDWITVAELAAAAATVAMLGVWALYAMLFYSEYRKRGQSWLLLHHADGSTLESRCVLVNLSEHIVHISAVVAVAHGRERRVARRLSTSPGVLPGDDVERDGPAAFREGPLHPGGALFLGTFAQLFDDLVPLLDPPRDDGLDGYRDVETVEIRVVADDPRAHEHDPVGAHRRYALRPVGRDVMLVEPEDRSTRQLRDGAGRAEVTRWLEETMQPEAVTGVEAGPGPRPRHGRPSQSHPPPRSPRVVNR